MIGKTVKIEAGLFRGEIGVVTNKFVNAGKELYMVKIKKVENAAGQMYYAFTTVTIDEMKETTKQIK